MCRNIMTNPILPNPQSKSAKARPEYTSTYGLESIRTRYNSSATANKSNYEPTHPYQVQNQIAKRARGDAKRHSVGSNLCKYPIISPVINKSIWGRCNYLWCRHQSDQGYQCRHSKHWHTYSSWYLTHLTVVNLNKQLLYLRRPLVDLVVCS